MTQALGSLDAKQIFDHAQKFQLTQEYMRHRDRATTHEYVMMCADPCMVLSALASELFFKCLLVIEGKSKKDFERLHDLQKLYSKLSVPIQDKIRALWDQQVWSQGTRD